MSHGERRSAVSGPPSRASSTASARTLSAISTSTGRDGTAAHPSAAADSVMLCPRVKAVMVLISRRDADSRSTRPRTKSR
jgi:hypothetical protein